MLFKNILAVLQNVAWCKIRWLDCGLYVQLTVKTTNIRKILPNPVDTDVSTQLRDRVFIVKIILVWLVIIMIS